MPRTKTTPPAPGRTDPNNQTPDFLPDQVIGQMLQVVKEAGGIISANWDTPRSIKMKGRIDLVTDTDLAVEKFLLDALPQLVPGSVTLSEEASAQGYDETLLYGKNPVWVIDPLDGTTNFAHHVPFVNSSVALWQYGKPLLAVVEAPILGETFHAVSGGGAFCNGKPIKVSACESLEQGLAATGFPYDIEGKIDEVMGLVRKLLLNCRGLRRCGAAALDLAHVAAGRYDVFLEFDLKPWDSAAGVLLVNEAGGRVSRMDGGAYCPGDRDMMASNGLLHNNLIKIMSAS